jgi:hypothetical protein
MQHSTIVGGSTAKRVINCPGSVALVAKMPPQPPSKYADEGTLLHQCMDELLNTDITPDEMRGRKYNGVELTPDLIQDKLTVALAAIEEIDPDCRMTYKTEVNVDFGDFLPDVFGNCDLMGRIGKKAIILDWKFGDGVAIDATENPQLMFYACAAMRSQPEFFKDAEEFELIIVQPPAIKRWTTDRARLRQFELELKAAVETAQTPNAPTAVGEHCRFCTAKPICPQMNGSAERMLRTQLDVIPVDQLGQALTMADKLEEFIADLRKLAFDRLEQGMPVPGYKLVAKRATRQWADEHKAVNALIMAGLPSDQIYKAELISPAQAEKALKKSKATLPDDLVVAVSSGNTIARQDDPRPAVMVLGKQLVAALSKIQ